MNSCETLEQSYFYKITFVIHFIINEAAVGCRAYMSYNMNVIILLAFFL